MPRSASSDSGGKGARLYGVVIFATLIAGQRADFVSPVVLGDLGAMRFRGVRHTEIRG